MKDQKHASTKLNHTFNNKLLGKHILYAGELAAVSKFLFCVKLLGDTISRLLLCVRLLDQAKNAIPEASEEI